jgi:hypothetical protein
MSSCRRTCVDASLSAAKALLGAAITTIVVMATEKRILAGRSIAVPLVFAWMVHHAGFRATHPDFPISKQ